MAKNIANFFSTADQNKSLFAIYKCIPLFVLRFCNYNDYVLLSGDHSLSTKLFTFLCLHNNVNYVLDRVVIDCASASMRFRLETIGRAFGDKLKIHHYISGIFSEDSADSFTKFSTACLWVEREIFDMYGLMFKEHADLRRILTDYGFQGFPLRKDFPLSGYFEVRYDAATGRVVSEEVELTQEYRFFDFLSPWYKG